MSAFGDAFNRARKKFENSGSANDYIFEFPKGSGKKFTILKKGETKSGVMKKFAGPKKSLTPKLRPNKEKPLTQKQKDAIRDAQKSTRTDLSKDDGVTPKRKAKPGGTAVPPRAGVGAGRFAGKGAGKDKPMDKGVQVPRADPPKGKPRNPRDNQSQSMKGMTEREKFILKKKMSQKRSADEVAKVESQIKKKRDAKKVLAALDQQGPDKSASYKAGKPRDPKDNQRRQKGVSFRAETEMRKEITDAEKRAIRRKRKKLLDQRKEAARLEEGMNKTPSKPQISDSARGKLDNEYERPVRVGRDAPRGKMLADDYYDAYGSGGMAKKKSGYMGGGMAKKKGVMTYNLGGMVKSQVNNLKGKK